MAKTTKTIDLTEDEANILLQFIDIGVKNGGLKVAQPAAHLAGKINAAFATEETKQKKEEKPKEEENKK